MTLLVRVNHKFAAYLLTSGKIAVDLFTSEYYSQSKRDRNHSC